MSRVEYVTLLIEHQVAQSAQDWDWYMALDASDYYSGLIKEARVLGVVEREANDDLPTSVSTVEEMEALPQGATLRDTDGNSYIKADTDDKCWMCIGTATSHGRNKASWYSYQDVILPAIVSKVDL